jgi:3-oxoacyl-[acyl-carrier protein] reductase
MGGGVYAMSKAALIGLVKGLARDLGPRVITINNVQPGPVETDMNPSTTDFAKILMQIMALHRYGTGDEIALLVAYLAKRRVSSPRTKSTYIQSSTGLQSSWRI